MGRSAGHKRKDHGGPNKKFFDCPETISAFDAVKTWIHKHCRKYFDDEPPSTSQIISLVITLIQFQEDNLGRSPSVQPICTRLPMSSILDFKPGGGLCQILETAYRMRYESGWSKLNFKSSKRDRNMKLVAEMRRTLLNSKTLIMPHIYLTDELEKELRKRLKEIIRKHEAELVKSYEEATHIIHPITGSNIDQDLIRVVLRRERGSLLHFCFTPDSYDTWITDVNVLMAPNHHQERNGPFQVSASWLIDLERFNEWMNEEDYEVDFSGNPLALGRSYTWEQLIGKEKHDKRKKKQKTRSRSPEQDKKKRSKASKVGKNSKFGNMDITNEPVVEDLTKDLPDPEKEPRWEEISIPPQLPPVKGAKDSGMAPLRAPSILDLDSIQMNFSGSSASQLTQSISEGKSHIIVPTRTSWFDYNSIHMIERRCMSDFFDGTDSTKTPEIYFNYRNFMIDLYRAHPNSYLSVKTIRKKLPGGLISIVRLFTLLEMWGLINNSVSGDSKPLQNAVCPPLHVLVDGSEGVEPASSHISLENPLPSLNILNLPPFNEGNNSESQTLYGLNIEEQEDANALNKMKYAATVSQDWTERETLLLLEAVEMYQDDWGKVCRYVGDRTQDECISQFLRLPIEDKYIDDKGESFESNDIPFSKASNPIMCTIAFIASVVDPRIAAAAANAAMSNLSVTAHIKTESTTQVVPVDKSQRPDSAGSDGNDLPPTECKVVEKENQIITASRAAVAAAKECAAQLGGLEERKIKGQVISLMDHLMKKLEIKLKHFEEIDAIMQTEKMNVHTRCQQLDDERRDLHIQQLAATMRDEKTSQGDLFIPNNNPRVGSFEDYVPEADEPIASTSAAQSYSQWGQIPTQVSQSDQIPQTGTNYFDDHVETVPLEGRDQSVNFCEGNNSYQLNTSTVSFPF